MNRRSLHLNSKKLLQYCLNYNLPDLFISILTKFMNFTNDTYFYGDYHLNYEELKNVVKLFFKENKLLKHTKFRENILGKLNEYQENYGYYDQINYKFDYAESHQIFKYDDDIDNDIIYYNKWVKKFYSLCAYCDKEKH